MQINGSAYLGKSPANHMDPIYQVSHNPRRMLRGTIFKKNILKLHTFKCDFSKIKIRFILILNFPNLFARICNLFSNEYQYKNVKDKNY